MAKDIVDIVIDQIQKTAIGVDDQALEVIFNLRAAKVQSFQPASLPLRFAGVIHRRNAEQHLFRMQFSTIQPLVKSLGLPCFAIGGRHEENGFRGTGPGQLCPYLATLRTGIRVIGPKRFMRSSDQLIPVASRKQAKRAIGLDNPPIRVQFRNGPALFQRCDPLLRKRRANRFLLRDQYQIAQRILVQHSR